MKLIEITWDGEEANVRYTQDFLTASRILQLDALVDAKLLLETAYDALLKGEKRWHKPQKEK